MSRLSTLLIIAAVAALVCVSCKDGGPPPSGPDSVTHPGPQRERPWLDPNASEDIDEPPPPVWQDYPERITDPGVVAIVGEKKITRDEFFAELEERYKPQALSILIDDAIITLESERAGLQLSTEEVRAFAEKMADLHVESLTEEINRAYRGRKTLEEYLRETRGVGVDEFKAQNVRKAVEEGIAEKQKRVELLVSYERLTSARVRISHVQVNTEEKATEIIKRIKAGEKISKIAQEESEDGYSRSFGGALDPFHKGDEEFRKDIEDLGPEFLNAVFAAKVGLMEKPLKSGRNAWHVVMVFENQPACDKTLARMKPEIEKDIEDGINESDGFYWLQRKRYQYKIEEKSEGGVCAVVGPRKITADELHDKLNAMFGRETIQRMITDRIVELESSRIGLKNTGDETQKMAKQIVEDRIRQIRQMLTYQFPMQFGRTFTLDDYIRNEMGKSLAQYTADSTKELVTGGQAEEELTLAKLVSHYLMTTERVTVQQAVFENEYAARDAWTKLRQGADFTKIAQKHNPEALAASDGILPSFSREEYYHRPDLLAAGKNLVKVAFATGRGRFSGVFRCKDGWRIIKVLERGKAEDLPYSALKMRIRDEVFEGREWALYVPIWTRVKARSISVAIKLPSAN